MPACRVFGIIAFFATSFTGLVCGETLSDGLRANDAGHYDAPAGFGSILPRQVALMHKRHWQTSTFRRQPAFSMGQSGRRIRIALATGLGNSVALMNFGDLYAQGVGVERELGRAAFLLRLALDIGFDWAVQRLQKFKPRMSANDHARFWRLRAEWSDQLRK